MNATRYPTTGGNVVVWKPNGDRSPHFGPLGNWECKGCHDTEQGRSRSIAETHAKHCNAC